jgi:hypothetical protein
MLIDIDDGRPTEGEHIIGDLVERATLVALVRTPYRRFVQSPSLRNQPQSFAMRAGTLWFPLGHVFATLLLKRDS